jgi:hypothetical protein
MFTLDYGVMYITKSLSEVAVKISLHEDANKFIL